LLLALRRAPQHESAFQSGARGETAVGAYLDRRGVNRSAILLHDRRMPGGRGNIDHLAIAPKGVFVIDAKNHSGKVSVRKPLFGRAKLRVAGRDRTRYISGLERQLEAVREALAAAGHADVPVQGVLCFPRAELPLLGTLKIGAHRLLRRRTLARRLSARGPLDSTTIELLARILAASLRPA
jgi:hypothetical protein